jgi:nucleotide-binding universal stress UspA family protein
MKILLAVDGSEYSVAAVEEAARRPWPKGSMVRIVSVAEILTLTLPIEWERSIEERAVTNTVQAMARFSEIAGAQTEVIMKVLKGDPKAALLDEAEKWKADLIILGTHGYNALKRIWLGSVSRAVATNAKCSVEIVRRRETQISGRRALKILLAVDGSESSVAAVDEITNRPWPPGSEVHIISVIHLPFIPTPETMTLADSYYSLLEREGREHAESTVSRVVSQFRGGGPKGEMALSLSSEVIIGHPEEAIIETAKTWDADLIVLGSHGYSGFKRFLLGSVSEAVASHAPCSVEIVRKYARSE